MNKLHSIDASNSHPLLKEASINVLCDVKNILCGPTGAAAVYGPQKGADAEAVNSLDHALHQLAKRIEQLTGKSVLNLPAGGSAGGTAAGLHALLNANLMHGIDYFLDITGFNTSLSGANIVITGEGRLDEQTMQGKAPFGVAFRAKAAGKKTVCIAGIVPSEPDELMTQMFDYILSTIPSASRPGRELAFENLKQTSMEAATRLFIQS
jgi:glycerate kinase